MIDMSACLPKMTATDFGVGCQSVRSRQAEDPRDEVDEVRVTARRNEADSGKAVLDLLWEQLGGAAYRQDFRIDPVHYGAIYKDVVASGQDLIRHYYRYGIKERRKPNRFHHSGGAETGDIHEVLTGLVVEPRLRALLHDDVPGSAELAYELIALGDPIDKQVSNFSADHYAQHHKDVAKAKADPFNHYIKFGHGEKRRVLDQIRANVTVGQIAYDPAWPTCLICTHEFSRTGAPIVALQIVREASLTHNVIVMGRRGGALHSAFCSTACHVIVSGTPFVDWDYFNVPELADVDFAIINSVECYAFIQPVVAASVPFAAYIHEFSDYIVPGYKSMLFALYADRIVFSSASVQATWQGVLTDVGFDIVRHSSLLAQSSLTFQPVQTERCAEARARLSSLLDVACGTRRIVYGAGQIGIRKGTDLFVLAAQQMRELDPATLFIWIGDGANHEDISFGVWLDKHMREAGANVAGGNLFFIPAGPHYQDVCTAADALFLSSRLDPLPNVVFDAAAAGCMTVVFKGATGFDDTCYDAMSSLVRVGYGNLPAAVRALRRAPRKLSWHRGLSSRGRHKQIVAEEVALFESMRILLPTVEANADVSDAQYQDVSVLFRGDDIKRASDLRNAERSRLSRLIRRAIWPDADTARNAAAGEGGWMHARTRIEPYADIPADSSVLSDLPPLHIHIHAHYLDDLESDLARFAAYRIASTVIATTDTEIKADKIREYGTKAGLAIDVRVTGNQGRDILPFLNVVRDHSGDDTDIWCHVHQKRSLTSTVGGDQWRAFLMRILLGDGAHISSAVTQIAQAGTGLVTAFDPYIVGWNGSRRLIPDIDRRLARSLPQRPLLFPVGNMFWTRAGVARRMFDVFGENYAWPNEPLPNDGTVYHMIERLWPAISAMSDLGSVFLDRPGTKRA